MYFFSCILDQADYENADLSQQRASQASGGLQEVKVTANEVATSEQVTVVTASESESVQSTARVNVAKTDQSTENKEKITNENVADKMQANDNLEKANEDKDLTEVDYENVAEVSVVKHDEVKGDVRDEADTGVDKTNLESANVNKDTSVKANIEQDGMKIDGEEAKSGSQIKEDSDEKKAEVQVEQREKSETVEVNSQKSIGFGLT